MTYLRRFALSLFFVLLGCTGPLKRMNKAISGDAGAILYEYQLKSCPAPSVELPIERTSQVYQIKASNFYNPNIFVKKMRYCHGFTKYSFERISDDRFYVFSAYARIDRDGPSCSLQVATLAQIECSKNAKECDVVKEQDEYVGSFVGMLLPEGEEPTSVSDIQLFRNGDEWESWCHKRIRLKTFR